MTDIAIRAAGLSKSFTIGSHMRAGLKDRLLRRVRHQQVVWALRDASFEVERGKSLGIIGHNGAGKSTALKVLAGIYVPTAGTVEVRGRVSALLELGAGFHPDLTGRENIQLNGAILGMSKRQIAANEDDIIDFSGIEEQIDLPVKTYSSGMSMRLGFAITAKLDPEILIIDEVIAVGDEAFRLKCNAYMQKLIDAGTTMLMVSHSMATVGSMCDTAVWLDHGTVKGYGSSKDVVDSYTRSVMLAMDKERDDVPGPVSTRDVSISSIEFIDREGIGRTVLGTGLPMTVRLHHVASRDARVQLGFTLRVANQATPMVDISTAPVRISEGEGYVDYVVPQLTVPSGSYAVGTYVRAADEIIDSCPDQAMVMVVSPDPRARIGLPGQWST